RKQEVWEKVQQLKADSHRLNQELSRAKEQQMNAEQEMKQIVQQWNEADTDDRKLQHHLQSQLHRTEKIYSQLELLKEMQKNREGYFRGVKALLQEKEQGNAQLSGI